MTTEKKTYSDLVREIENAPRTWLPGLFITFIQECEKRKVFRDGGMQRIMDKIHASAGERPNKSLGEPVWGEKPPSWWPKDAL